MQNSTKLSYQTNKTHTNFLENFDHKKCKIYKALNFKLPRHIFLNVLENNK